MTDGVQGRMMLGVGADAAKGDGGIPAVLFLNGNMPDINPANLSEAVQTLFCQTADKVQHFLRLPHKT